MCARITFPDSDNIRLFECSIIPREGSSSSFVLTLLGTFPLSLQHNTDANDRNIFWGSFSLQIQCSNQLPLQPPKSVLLDPGRKHTQLSNICLRFGFDLFPYSFVSHSANLQVLHPAINWRTGKLFLPVSQELNKHYFLTLATRMPISFFFFKLSDVFGTCCCSFFRGTGSRLYRSTRLYFRCRYVCYCALVSKLVFLSFFITHLCLFLAHVSRAEL